MILRLTYIYSYVLAIELLVLDYCILYFTITMHNLLHAFSGKPLDAVACLVYVCVFVCVCVHIRTYVHTGVYVYINPVIVKLKFKASKFIYNYV